MKTLRKFISIAVVSGLISVGAATSAHADTLVPATTETAATLTVDAVVTDLSDGGQLYTYDLPDGSVMTVPYPPADFDPLTASDEQLAQYDIEPRPADVSDLETWNATYASYGRPEKPQNVVTILVSQDVGSTYYNNKWGGWAVGQPTISSHTYTDVKGTFVLPTLATTCNLLNPQIIWVGLGGMNNQANDLVQLGVARCVFFSPYTGDYYPGWYAFSDFADSGTVTSLCQTQSILGSPLTQGHHIYVNLRYNYSVNTATLYLDDTDSTGGSIACTVSPKSGQSWTANGATAEWISERIGKNLDDYGSVVWTGAQVQTAVDGLFHTIASQPYTKVQTGTSGSLCQATSNVTNNFDFHTDWLAGVC